jgi:putative spermidine/putrescine transport system substrate-binding protein
MARRIGRRTLVGGIGAAGALAALPAMFRGAQAQAGKLVVTSYPGIWEKAINECFVAEFKRKHPNVAIEVAAGNPDPWIAQIQANPANPPYHVLVATPDSASVAVKAGIVDKISADKVPNLVDIPKEFVDMAYGHGAAFDYGAAGLMYHKDRVKNPPKSFKEFIERTIKGEWRAGLPTPSFGPAMQAFFWSFADVLGGGVDNMDPFFDAVKKMKPHVTFWTPVTAPLQLLDSGEIDISLYYDGRAWANFNAGKTYTGFINPIEGGVMSPVVVMKVKNAPEIAWEYVNIMLAPAPQLAFAKIMTYGVTNRKVVYPPDLKEKITPWDKTRFPPNEKIAERKAQWVERWNKEIGA